MKYYTKLSDFTSENFIEPRKLLELLYDMQSDLDAMIDDETPEDDEDFIELQESVDQLKKTLEYLDLDETLIRNSYMNDYLIELVYDIGDLPNNLPSYIESNIDWNGVCDDLKMDYSCVEIDGVEYWQRNC